VWGHYCKEKRRRKKRWKESLVMKTERKLKKEERPMQAWEKNGICEKRGKKSAGPIFHNAISFADGRLREMGGKGTV